MRQCCNSVLADNSDAGSCCRSSCIHTAVVCSAPACFVPQSNTAKTMSRLLRPEQAATTIACNVSLANLPITQTKPLVGEIGLTTLCFMSATLMQMRYNLRRCCIAFLIPPARDFVFRLSICSWSATQLLHAPSTVQSTTLYRQSRSPLSATG